MSSILTSDKLIATIRRRAFIPRSQETFSNDDFLEMATEEINLGIMEKLINARGDYLVYFEDIPVVENTLSYAIPSRAHGNKLRDAHIVDRDGQTVYELTQTTLEERLDLNRFATFQRRTNFYMENDCIILHEDVAKPAHSIRMWFYMRPNKLVQNSRAGIVTQLSKSIEIDSVSPMNGAINAISADLKAVVTSPSHGLSSGKIILTGSNSTPSIDGVHTIIVIDANTFSVDVTTTISGTSGTWVKGVEVVVATISTIPSHFTGAIKYDIVRSYSPNKLSHFNLHSNTVNTTLKTISFRHSSAPDLNVGDYITKAEESIVPNIPTELHPIVAQKVAIACLEAMGDEQNKVSAERKLAQMEMSALKIITNRVEGAPKKIKNRFGTLNSGKKIW